MSLSRDKQRAFTIVELLIAVVVIGILATITVVAYSGVVKKANDTTRLSDVHAIQEALQRYYIEKGNFPDSVVAFDWELSGVQGAGSYLTALKPYGLPRGAPVDPINNATNPDSEASYAAGKYGYWYYRYNQGDRGCDPLRGNYYVFGVVNMESVNGTHPNSPGFSCSLRNWQLEFEWVTGGYER